MAGRVLMSAVVGSGLDPDELTATPEDVIEGKKFGGQGDDEPQEGSMPNLSFQILPRDGTTAHVTNIDNLTTTSAGYCADVTFEPPYIGYINATRFTQAIYGVHPDCVKYGQAIGANPSGGGFHLIGNYTGDANATEPYMLSGQIAYSKGKKIHGQMPNRTMVDPSIGGINGNYPNVAVHKASNPQVAQTTVSRERLLSFMCPTGYYDGSYVGSLMSDVANVIGARPEYILKGHSICDVPGTFTVNSALSFSIAAISGTEIEIYWTNPSKGPFNGVFVQMGTSGYPGTSGGTRVYTGIGTNSNPGGRSSCKITGLQPNTKYYFTVASYCDPLPWEGITNLTATTTSVGTIVFTSSQSWSIPQGVRKVDVFLVGGGCCGGDSFNGYYFSNCGGSSGNTITYRDVDVSSINTINIVVGAGSTNNSSNIGGESAFGAYKVSGGSMIELSSNPVNRQNRGGSGGGDSSRASITSETIIHAGNGGADGSNGSTNRSSQAVVDINYGKGQGTTTRAFGESSGTLYAAGGGGGASGSRAHNSQETRYGIGGTGGAGGGGAGGDTISGYLSPKSEELYLLNAQNATPNTGSGGGGCGYDAWIFKVGVGDWKVTRGNPGTGASGVVIVRWK